ncbi:hypothetical protein EVAR_4492_1 [Eumeta japonica]|uniref:Uncharacterized protein n=1 Tax=Eumeta variegata TaxID=151549 RepID=A0A4C1SYS8_EUMVA|nr:hypothetical protein EVAR_4492_1 [Eumeta japonica]
MAMSSMLKEKEVADSSVVFVRPTKLEWLLFVLTMFAGGSKAFAETVEHSTEFGDAVNRRYERWQTEDASFTSPQFVYTKGVLRRCARKTEGQGARGGGRPYISFLIVEMRHRRRCEDERAAAAPPLYVEESRIAADCSDEPFLLSRLRLLKFLRESRFPSLGGVDREFRPICGTSTNKSIVQEIRFDSENVLW